MDSDTRPAATGDSPLTATADVVVIGGGPAGSTASTVCAQAGLRVTLLEREVFPRFHIGESLIPETYWVLKRIGMLEKMKASAFVKKHSVQFVSASGKLSEPFYFHDNRPHECSQTWQVLRSEFDQLMLNNAREHGVDVHEGARVLEVLFDGSRAVGVRVQDRQGTVRQVHAKVVMDASGQSALLGNRLKLLVKDPVLLKAAVWTYYQGAYRDQGRDEGATLVLQTKTKNGWFWYIPLHNDVVSIGIVSSFEYLFQGRGDHETIFNQELDNCPVAKQRVACGRRIAPYFATKDYSYRCRQPAGDGWVLVGDAYGFLDPLYSSGVLLALSSGSLAADAVVEAIRSDDTSAARLGNWAPAFNAGMDRMRRLVCEYYGGFSFGGFVKRFPEHKGHLTDLLIGDLFREEAGDVFSNVDQYRRERDQAPAPV
jgi:flavin-dependent dehydrogenase